MPKIIIFNLSPIIFSAKPKKYEGKEKGNNSQKNVTFDKFAHVGPKQDAIEIPVTSETVQNIDRQESTTLSNDDAEEQEVQLLMDDYAMNFNDLRKVLIRSKERLDRNLLENREGWQDRERRLIEKANVIPKGNDGGRITQSQTTDSDGNVGEHEFLENKENVIPATNQMLHVRQQGRQTLNRGDNTEKSAVLAQEMSQVDRCYPLPSWNLSTERLKYISQGTVIKYSYF